ncbi:hypothetical protein AAHE18_12G069300 [Arachis hypogaea]
MMRTTMATAASLGGELAAGATPLSSVSLFLLGVGGWHDGKQDTAGCDGFGGVTATVTRRCSFDGVRLLSDFRSDSDVTSLHGGELLPPLLRFPFLSLCVFFILTA